MLSHHTTPVLRARRTILASLLGLLLTGAVWAPTHLALRWQAAGVGREVADAVVSAASVEVLGDAAARAADSRAGFTSRSQEAPRDPAPAPDPTNGSPAPPARPEALSSCDPPRDLPVPTLIGSIFRCRLTEAGFTPDEVQRVTAEALVVAECESHFDPQAVVFNGQYLNRPHPATGSYYTAAGVFQFLRARADRWVAGGYANVTDPVANIDAAARLYVNNVRHGFAGWSDWACAAANDGFRGVSVLPGWPGGPPDLPAWAFDH